MRTRVIVAALFVLALTGGKAINGDEMLKIQVSPAVAAAPAFITIRTVIDKSDDNRGLEVMAQSPDFSRTSTIDLEGVSSPRVNVFNFANLPAGEYTVSALLIGQSGVRATTTARTVLIMPTPGARR